MTHALVVAAVICWAGGEPAVVSFTTLARGVDSQVEDPRQVLVRTPEEWTALWKEHAGLAKPPEVDFLRSSVIAVFLGTRDSAGYSVEVAKVEKDEKGLSVTWRERRPGPGMVSAQMLTFPFHIVRIQRHDGPVRFTRAR